MIGVDQYSYVLASGNWPVEPRDETHPIGNSGGELQVNSAGFHNGIDIIVDKPWPDGHYDGRDHYIVTKETGTIRYVSPLPPVSNCGKMCSLILELPDANQTTHLYLHLDENSINADFEKDMVLPAGTRLGQVTQWEGCPNHWNHDFYHHLHFEIYGKSGQLEPVLSLIPRAESIDPLLAPLAGPFIDDVLFTTNDSLGTPTIITASQQRTVLHGEVDIVVKAYDRQFATATQSHKTGVLKILYHLSDTHGIPITTDKNGNPISPDRTIDFSTIPLTSSDATKIYGLSGPITSISQYCVLDQDVYYYIVTNTNADPTDPDKFEKQFSFDTTQYANGLYIVWITVWDSSGNSKQVPKQVEIQN